MTPSTASARPVRHYCSVSIAPLIFLIVSLWVCKPLFYGPAPDPDRPGVIEPRFHNLLFDSHEKLLYVIRLSEFHDAMTHGQWLVRWCRNLDGGYGYPFFNFYAPLSYYLAEIWRLAGLDLFLSWKLHFLIMMWFSGWFMYGFSRLFFSKPAAVFAGLLYLLAPYHITNLYVRGNVAEFTAMTFLPWMLWAFHRLARDPRPRELVGAAVSLAAIVLSHNLTALFAAVIIVVYLSVLWVAMGRRFPVQWMALAGLAAALLSAFFWIPALFELQYVKSNRLWATFLGTPLQVVRWRQFFENEWGFGLSLPGPKDGMPFMIGWAHWLAIAVSTVLLALCAVRRFRRGRFSPESPWRPSASAALVWLAALWVVLFLMTPGAEALWHVPALASIQFPWRLLSVACLCSAMVGAFSIEAMAWFAPRAAVRFWIAILGVALALVMGPKIGVSGYFTYHPNEIGWPLQTRMAPYRLTTNIGEFEPVWVNRPAGADAPPPVSGRRVLNAEGARQAAIHPSQVTRADFRLNLKRPGLLRYEVHYFPGWRVFCDGRPIDVFPSRLGGLIAFNGLEGDHAYAIRLGYSPWRRAGIACSCIGAALLAVSGFLRRNNRSRADKQTDAKEAPREE